MNLYFLVEGKRTEIEVYPAWLKCLLPEFTQVTTPDQVSRKTYYLVSGEGYPSLLGTHLHNAIKDVNSRANYDYLVVCLDADESTSFEREETVRNVLIENAWVLTTAQLQVVVQNRTIETWFLGNRKMISDAPQRSDLRRYLAFYDIRLSDPELMELLPEFEYHSQFHHEYLKEVFRERGMRYNKLAPGHVKDKTYLDQLLSRVDSRPHELKSFQSFVGFCREVERLSKL